MKYRSRKFLGFLFVTASATILVAAGSISDGVYSAVVIAALGGYYTANVAQKKVEKTA